MCSGDEASKKLAESFLTEFLGLYDGPDGEQTRKRLMEAYDERVCIFVIFVLKIDQFLGYLHLFNPNSP
jgi:hypothetical protein